MLECLLFWHMTVCYDDPIDVKGTLDDGKKMMAP